MIQVQEVSLTIKKRKILSDITMSLREGNIYGLVGNNGCGKTMLMRCICGFVKPTSGTVTVDGKIIGKNMDYLREAGIILETPGFISYYSGFQNLKLLAGISSKPDKKKIKDSMRLCGLNPDLKLPVRKYSLGMRQRLGIAQAIMEDQRILILDELMNGLDRHGVEDIRKLLLALKEEGRLILLTSHNMTDIEMLCDKVYEMDNGKLISHDVFKTNITE